LQELIERIEALAVGRDRLAKIAKFRDVHFDTKYDIFEKI